MWCTDPPLKYKGRCTPSVRILEEVHIQMLLHFAWWVTLPPKPSVYMSWGSILMREVGLNGEKGAGVGDLVSRLPDVVTLGSAVNRDPEPEESSSSATGVSPTVGRLGGEKVWFPRRLGLWEPLATTWVGSG